MITNTYKKMLTLTFLQFGNMNTPTGLTMKDVAGVSRPVYLRNQSGISNNYAIRFDRSTVNASGLYLGDGDTTETSEDYNLSGNIINSSALTANSPVIAQELEDGVFKQNYNYIITNNGDVGFIVKEYGFFYSSYDFGVLKSTNSSTGSFLFLAERVVLEEPIELLANSTTGLVLTRTVDFNRLNM